MTALSKIIVADDHPLFRAALAHALTSQFPTASIIEAGDFEEITNQIDAHDDTDVVLLDLDIPGSYGLSTLVYLHGHYPVLPVVIVSGTTDQGIIRKALQHGAVGFIPKSTPLDQVMQALQKIMAGEVWAPGLDQLGNYRPSIVPNRDLVRRIGRLTPAQFRVLMMLTEGLLNKQIAYEMNISEATVKAHMTVILKKLGVSNRTQAVVATQALSTIEADAESAADTNNNTAGNTAAETQAATPAASSTGQN